MSKKVTYRREVVDYTTGEVLHSTVEYKIKSDNFKFHMSNADLSWIKNFNNLTELQVLYLLMEYEDLKSGVVYVDSDRKKAMAKYLDLSNASIVKALENLVVNDSIVRVRRGCYMVNPLILFQGGTATLENKIEKYNEYKYQQQK